MGAQGRAARCSAPSACQSRICPVVQAHYARRRQGLRRGRVRRRSARIERDAAIAQNDRGRRSAIDGRTTRHPGYAISQQKGKRTEEPFGWGKTIGGLARPMLRGARKFTLTMAAYDLI